MSRRLGPYIFTGILGVVTGMYIFKPMFDDAAQRHGLGKGGVSSQAAQQSSKSPETK